MSDTHPKAGDKINVNIGGLSRPATVVDKPAYVELEGRVWFKYDDGTHGTWHIPVESLTLDLYADYPGGAGQYREDVATLTEAREWGFKPQDTGNNDHDVRVAEGDWNDIINALNAAGRFVPYAVGRCVGRENTQHARP